MQDISKVHVKDARNTKLTRDLIGYGIQHPETHD
jgi:hypothetical protein